MILKSDINYKDWDSKQDQILKDCVNNGKSYSEIADTLGRTTISCRSRAARLGVFSLYRHRKHSINHDFFKTPNPINCYWAGFLAADGNVRKTTEHNYVITLMISKKDINHLKTYKESLSLSQEIKEYSKPNNPTPFCYLSFSSQKIGKDLDRNFGVISNKTFRAPPPKLPCNFLNLCFYIGYFCGDGSMLINIQKGGRLNLNMRIVSCNKLVLEWFKTLIENLNLKGPQKERGGNTVWTPNERYFYYSVTCIKAFVLFDLLKDFPVPKLARKWNRPDILEELSKKKSKYPHLFANNESLRAKLFEEYSASCPVLV